MTAQITTAFDPQALQLNCRGDWDLAYVQALSNYLDSLAWPTTGSIIIDGSGVTKMDSAGAWLLLRRVAILEKNNIKVALRNFANEYQTLLNIVQQKVQTEAEKKLPEKPPLNKLAFVGRETMLQIDEMRDYLTFIGAMAFEMLRMFRRPNRFRFDSLYAVIYRTGLQALPIIGLLSFMIGVVIAYQMGVQLRFYGANIYIVDFLGLSVLREFGVLITAIMVAGRTGSAFTAQLGLMKVNQELDAISTMGITPAEILLIPRIIGLFIVLPLLTMWSNIFGVLGGMMMANGMLGISWDEFLQRFGSVIPLKTLFIGLGKAPVFALLIASIGCFEGMEVESSADSIGRNTTRSVVLAIFFIIVADALFSILFEKFDL